jgi:hypothetical protein
MGMLLKDGKDYLKPAVEHGTPTVSSRVIDILYQGETPNYILTTERPKYNEAQGFQETFDRIRARESVRPPMHAAWDTMGTDIQCPEWQGTEQCRPHLVSRGIRRYRVGS